MTAPKDWIFRQLGGPTKSLLLSGWSGRFPLNLPGTSGATMWFDTSDRAPLETLTTAVKKCQAAGARLPSERDLTEAIRKGPPNGSSSLIWTSDLEIGLQGAAASAGAVKWSAIETAFTDRWDGVGANFTAMVTSTAHPYRCMWTNELR